MAYDYEKFLVSRWDMSNVNTPDTGFIGQGADMTGVGLVAATNIVQGRTSWATEFNGANEYMVRTEADWRSQDSQGTITAWVKRNAINAFHDIFASGDEATADARFEVGIGDTARGDALLLTHVEGGVTTAWVRGATALLADHWYHIALTSNGTAYMFFVNGVAEAPTILAGANNGNWLADTSDRDNITIGARDFNAATSAYFDGSIDDVRYYSQPLSNLDIADLYARSRRGATGG